MFKDNMIDLTTKLTKESDTVFARKNVINIFKIIKETIPIGHFQSNHEK